MLPDPAEYTQCIRDSLAEMSKAATAVAGGALLTAPKKARTKAPAKASARRAKKPTAFKPAKA
jgi:hypothetical protein